MVMENTICLCFSLSYAPLSLVSRGPLPRAQLLTWLQASQAILGPCALSVSGRRRKLWAAPPPLSWEVPEKERFRLWAPLPDGI